MCTTKATVNNYKVSVTGNLSNLPDGQMYLLNEQNERIDSTDTKNGIFGFQIFLSDSNRYGYASLEHIDQTGVQRFFNFKSNRTFRGGPLLPQYFILEREIKISGNLLDVDPVSLKLYKNIKLVYPSEKIKGGIQNDVFINVNFNFSDPQNDSTVDTLQALIKKYPFSYYLLHELNIHRNNYTTQQLKDFLALFNSDVRELYDFKALDNAIAIRNNDNTTILNTNFKSTNGEVNWFNR
ncbi:MAG: DUF4369 domain-containing protein [Chitinophagaceae bacterium]|nr:DUF4369 domain-containing protein [Chitinophagaceae bacterium]